MKQFQQRCLFCEARWHAARAGAHAEVQLPQHDLFDLPYALPRKRVLLFLLSLPLNHEPAVARSS